MSDLDKYPKILNKFRRLSEGSTSDDQMHEKSSHDISIKR
jgi:hypothetical protein